MFLKKSKRRRGKLESFSFRKIYPLSFSRNQRDESLHLQMLKTENNVESSQQDASIEWTVEALLPTIRLAIYFGLLPVSTTTLHHANDRYVLYTFRWFSLRTFGTILLLFCLCVIETTALKYMVTGFYYSTKLETIEQTTAGAAFYGYSVISTTLFLRLATKLRNILDIWHHSEAPLLLQSEILNSYKLLKSRSGNASARDQNKLNSGSKFLSLKQKFTILSCIVLSLALAEHLWHVIVRVLESYNEVNSCQKESTNTVAVPDLMTTTKTSILLTKNGTFFNKKIASSFHDKLKAKCLESIYTVEDYFSLRVLESFSRRSHWFVYEQTKYAAWKGLSLVFISFVATFAWNFTDLFIMIISLALSTRFKQLNSKLSFVSGKALSPEHWEELRRQYTSLSDLSRTLDNNLNGMAFFSIASNLYFICIQLLSGLVTSTERTVDKSAFYFYSFGFLVGRAAAVILIASSINQETLNTPKHLHSCPHYSYCKEVQRFMMEVTTDSVALSGLNLFNITRNFLLAVAGAVVTYEIVLLQLETTNTNSS